MAGNPTEHVHAPAAIPASLHSIPPRRRGHPIKDDAIKIGMSFPLTPPATSPAPRERKTLVEEISSAECLENINTFIKDQKPGLNKFYTSEQLEDISKKAAAMANKLRRKKCGKETSKQLSILCLYDLVMLIDDSSSMRDEDGGERVKTLQETMEQIAAVYDLARPEGLLSVKFINAMVGYKDIDKVRVPHLIKKLSFWGTTQIGSALQNKVIEEFVFNPEKQMTKPLLIMTITDGGPEGESKGHLRSVIDDCVGRLSKEGGLGSDGLGSDAVAFHFSRVGKDKDAAKHLRKLDKACPTVDCLRAEYALERLKDKKSRWDVLPKLLLGAIVSTINQNDNEESSKKAQEAAHIGVQKPGDEEIVLSPEDLNASKSDDDSDEESEKESDEESD